MWMCVTRCHVSHQERLWRSEFFLGSHKGVKGQKERYFPMAVSRYFLSPSQMYILKLNVLIHGEYVCSSGQEERVQVMGWGAGKHCCSHLCGQKPKKPTWVEQTVKWLICKEKERAREVAGGWRSDMSKCSSSCWKKKAKFAVRIHSPSLTDGKTKVRKKAAFPLTKMPRYKLLITNRGLSKPTVSKKEQETKAKA